MNSKKMKQRLMTDQDSDDLPGFECSHCGQVFVGDPTVCISPSRNSSDGLPTCLCEACNDAEMKAAEEMEKQFHD
jgi:hypothetical protein